MRFVIRTNFDLCTGCSICQLACSERRTGGYNPRHALLRIKQINEGIIHEPLVCRQCRNPYCQTVCPADAIDKSDETGAVIIDREKCSGCGLCISNCYPGVIKWSRDVKKAVKCDLCGGNPVCVRECPTGALELVRVDGGE